MRYQLIIIFISLIFLLSCRQRNKEIYYIIKHQEPKLLLEGNPYPPDSLGRPAPPPPASLPLPFYGNYNFILVGENRVFFHTRIEPWYWCGTGRDLTKPEKLALRPQDFTQVKVQNLSKFLRDSLKADTLENGRFVFVKIGSPTDTIYNPGINTILKHLKSVGIRRYLVRNSTKEENCVLTSIIEKKPYHPDKCDFKVGFGGVKFNPPVQSDSSN